MIDVVFRALHVILAQLYPVSEVLNLRIENFACRAQSTFNNNQKNCILHYIGDIVFSNSTQNLFILLCISHVIFVRYFKWKLYILEPKYLQMLYKMEMSIRPINT